VKIGKTTKIEEEQPNKEILRVKETTTCFLLTSSNSLFTQWFYTRGWEWDSGSIKGYQGPKNEKMANSKNCKKVLI